MVKNLRAAAGDPRDSDPILGWGRFPGRGNGNLLQYSYLGSHVDRGALQATAHGQTTTTKTSRRRNDKPQLKYV